LAIVSSGTALDKLENPGGVVSGAAESSFVAIPFEQLNGQDGHGDIVGVECDDAFRVVGGARVVPQLEAGFDEGAINLGVAAIRIFLQECFEIAHQRGAVVSGIVDGCCNCSRARLFRGSGGFVTSSDSFILGRGQAADW